MRLVLVPILGGVLAIGLMLITIHAIEGVHRYPLTCEANSYRVPHYVCRLNDKSQFMGTSFGAKPKFLGVSLEMQPKSAFDSLCRSQKDSVWFLRIGDNKGGHSTPLTKGLRCDDWPRFAQSGDWFIRSMGEPCVGSGYLVVSVYEGHVSGMNVFCRSIVDAARPTWIDRVWDDLN